MRVTLCNQSGGSPEILPLSPEEPAGFTTPTLPSGPRWLSSGSREESMGSSMNTASVPPPLTLPSPRRAALLLPEDHEGVFKTGHLGQPKPPPLNVARIQQFPVWGDWWGGVWPALWGEETWTKVDRVIAKEQHGILGTRGRLFEESKGLRKNRFWPGADSGGCSLEEGRAHPSRVGKGRDWGKKIKLQVPVHRPNELTLQKKPSPPASLSRFICSNSQKLEFSTCTSTCVSSLVNPFTGVSYQGIRMNM